MMNKGSELLMNVKIFSVIPSNDSVNTLTVPDILPCANSRERRKSKQPLADNGQWLLRYSRWESNPNLRFRKPPFYPLNYRSIKHRPALRPMRYPITSCLPGRPPSCRCDVQSSKPRAKR